ncbi:hypothetical protein SLA2020_407440 [Shorea laevis]
MLRWRDVVPEGLVEDVVPAGLVEAHGDLEEAEDHDDEEALEVVHVEAVARGEVVVVLVAVDDDEDRGVDGASSPALLITSYLLGGMSQSVSDAILNLY